MLKMTISIRTAATIVATLVLAAFVALGGGGITAHAEVGYKLPWRAGGTYAVNQGWNEGSHVGYNQYAYDFGLPFGTEVLASASGVVTKAVGSNTSGQCGGTLNEVNITHADGSRTVYMHLNDVAVSLNQQVTQAQVIGHVGCTGFATGPHLHFQRDVNRAPAPVYFVEYPGQQLYRGQRVTSQNYGGDEPDRPIASGQTLSGVINSASDVDNFYFDMAAGQRATVQMTRTSGSLDSYLELFGPSGSRVAYDDDSGGNLNSLISNFALPQSGQYRIMAHSWAFASSGGYNVQLDLTSPSTNSPVVVDDPQLYGPSQYWLYYSIGYAGDMVATWNNGPCSYGPSVCPQNQDVNYAVWRPNLPATGDYRLCAWIPEDHAYTTSARYVIAQASGTSVVTVNQQPIWGWANLGVYHFNAGTSGYVRLGDWTGEAFGSRQVGFDAVKWVLGGGLC